jgi:putative spermidine/putrescine transport system permease protein
MDKLEREIKSMALLYTKMQSPPVLLGGVILILVTIAFYWVPIVFWSVSYISSESSQLPRDLPFLLLVNRTLAISFSAGLASVIAAYPLAIIWRISGEVSKYITVSFMVVPLIMGLLARNYSWIGMLSSSNTLSSIGWSLLGVQSLLYTQMSVYLVMSCIFVPVAFFMLVQGTSSVTQNHIDAARTLGVPDWKILFIVVIPLTIRAAVLAFGLNSAMAAGYFITPRMLGGGKADFISNAILISVEQGRFGIASVMAIFFLAIMILPITLITLYALRRRLFVTGR